MFKKLLLCSLFFMPAYLICSESDQEIKVLDLISPEGIRIIVTVGSESSEQKEKSLKEKLAIVGRTCKKWGKECEDALEKYIKCVIVEVHIRTMDINSRVSFSEYESGESNKWRDEADSQ